VVTPVTQMNVVNPDEIDSTSPVVLPFSIDLHAIRGSVLPVQHQPLLRHYQVFVLPTLLFLQLNEGAAEDQLRMNRHRAADWRFKPVGAQVNFHGF
jgi:hypothetical protein